MSRPLFSATVLGGALALMLVRNLGCGYPETLNPNPGDVAVTEVMADPTTGQPEWVELRNLTEGPLDLAGCCLAEGGAADHVAFLPDDRMLRPRRHLLIAEADLAQGPPDVLVLGDGALVLDEDDPTETLGLFCPRAGDMVLIDQVPLGELEAGARGHSWMVEDEAWASVRNDDPAGWCLASAETPYPTSAEADEYGTPGMPNQCGGGAGSMPLAGEVRITEIMVAPDAGSEWFELLSTVDQPLDLAGCVLSEGGDGAIHEHTLTGERGETVLLPGEGLVLCDSGLELVPGSEILADYEYTALTFNNADPEILILVCDGLEVDRAAYDWAALDGDKGQSVARDPGDRDRWCLSDEVFYSLGETTAWGSPGLPNPPCAVEPAGAGRPDVGEVVITEIMIAPSSGDRFPEWFEVLNLGDRDVDLDGCLVEDDGHAGTLTTTGLLAPGELAVIAADAFDPACDLTPLGEYGGSVTFNNSSPDRCALVCPSGDDWIVVDEVTYDWEAWDLDKGLSLILDAGSADADANDDPGAWCPTPTDAWSCTVEGFTDTGTPLTLPGCAES